MDDAATLKAKIIAGRSVVYRLIETRFPDQTVRFFKNWVSELEKALDAREERSRIDDIKDDIEYPWDADRRQ